MMRSPSHEKVASFCCRECIEIKANTELLSDEKASTRSLQACLCLDLHHLLLNLDLVVLIERYEFYLKRFIDLFVSHVI